MRFATNEHYYDAMKVLSRADVPTVEAGSFPTTKQQPAQYQPSNIQPDDSASQIGGINSGPQPYAIKAPVASEINTGPHPPRISTLTSAPTPHNMPPPNFRSIDHSFGQLPTIQNPSNRISGNHSNHSSITGTTLVPSIAALGYRADSTRGCTGMMPHTEVNNVVSGHIGTNRYENQQSSTTRLADQPTGLLLPPRRELPFPKPKSASKAKPPQDDIRTATRVTDQITDGPRDRAADNPETKSTEHDLPPSVPAGKAKGKRAATKTTTKTPAKKPRVATTRKKSAAKKAAKKDTPIPTVDELLERPELGRMTRSRSILAAEALNKNLNEQLKSPAKDDGVASALSQPSPRHDSIRRDISLAASRHVVQDLDSQGTLGEPAQPFPCTPADQIIQTHTPRPVTVTDNPTSPCKQGHRQEEQSQRDIATPFSNINYHHHQSAPHKTQVTTSMAKGPEKVLANDPSFANSEANLQAWASLPAEIRNPALRDFVCQSIMQPSFVDLCKSLENIWETALLEPRLRSRDT